MNELDRHRSFTHGRCDTLHASPPDISDRKDARDAGFEQMRRPGARPTGSEVRSRPNELLLIERQAFPEPSCVRVGARHQEKVLDVGEPWAADQQVNKSCGARKKDSIRLERLARCFPRRVR